MNIKVYIQKHIITKILSVLTHVRAQLTVVGGPRACCPGQPLTELSTNIDQRPVKVHV